MENKYDLQVNEKVRLISGGAQMILKAFCNDNKQVTCFWVNDEGNYYEKEFDIDVIAPVDLRKYFMANLEA